MTAAKLHKIFRILSTAGLSLVYEGNGQGKAAATRPETGEKRSQASSK